MKQTFAMGLLDSLAMLAPAALPQHGPGAGHPGMHAVLGQLGLTEAQKTQAHQIFEDARTQAQPVIEQMKAGHDQLAAAVKKNDTARMDALAAGQGALMGKVAGVHARAFAKFYAILTPEQQAKADQMHEFVRGMMAGHLGRMGMARH
jgi:Spy/CpxP family protein refolding chaperone